MEQKNIIGYSKEYEIKDHPSVEGLKIIEGKSNFPISWLNKQGYCEYQLYLEHMKGIKTQATPEMTHGIQIHKELENIFKESSTPSTFEDAVEASKKEASMSRECFVIAPDYGIRGYIDEIWMTPDEIVIIDDKPGRTPYQSTMNQVRAYCLAYKNMTNEERKIKGALRERGTGNLFWIEVFTPKVEKEIKFTIDRMHGLFDGTKPFIPTKNPNKCRSCNFKNDCEHAN
ncbi:MAG: Dna2/Cas4 domain-containing protein [Methanobrevibacter sp.]|uniref:CRISPR-associated protein Cas4 n=1 Tax=Methanobrevibacter sp. TaxID=66852 RepID=UPI0025FCC755|nr:PD-(D/E)XK nuclease family protein [Methanobrevibacter sp.]MBR6993057.1 Dna2/Cas4 domain-containing protein [Methanobrevibacter sp.]